MSKLNFREYAVRDSNGLTDVPATVRKFSEELVALKDKSEANALRCGAAIADVFEQHKGIRMPIPTVCMLALAKLGIEPSEYNDMMEACGDYLRKNAGDGKTFSIAKGKNGGIARTADQVKPAEATA